MSTIGQFARKNPLGLDDSNGKESFPEFMREVHGIDLSSGSSCSPQTPSEYITELSRLHVEGFKEVERGEVGEYTAYFCFDPESELQTPIHLETESHFVNDLNNLGMDIRALPNPSENSPSVEEEYLGGLGNVAIYGTRIVHDTVDTVDSFASPVVSHYYIVRFIG